MGKHEVKGSSPIRKSSGGSHTAPKHSVPDRRTDSFNSSQTTASRSFQADSSESWAWENPFAESQPEKQQSAKDSVSRNSETSQEQFVWEEPRRSDRANRSPEFTPKQTVREEPRRAESSHAASHAAASRRPNSSARGDSRRSESRHSSSHAAAPRRPATVAPAPADNAYVPLRRESAHPGSSPKKRSSRKKDPLLTGVSIVLVCVMLFAAFKLGSTILNYKKNRDTYSALNDTAVVRFTPKPVETTEEETEEVVLEDEPVSEVPITVNWEVLQQTNSDIVAWLYCEDTIISYPVVQAVDNDYYLTHDFYGNESSAGALFADKDSVVGLSASHLIIYGHNMKDNSMFGTLKGYVDEDYYTDHPVFYLLTPSQNYRMELIQAQTIEADLDNYPTYFTTESEKISYTDRLSSTAYWLNTDNIHSDLQLITFSTCTSSDDERFIVQGTLIPVD